VRGGDVDLTNDCYVILISTKTFAGIKPNLTVRVKHHEA
jgi:hypothetical protein